MKNTLFVSFSAGATVEVAQLPDTPKFGHAGDFAATRGEHSAEDACSVSSFFQSMLPQIGIAARAIQDAGQNELQCMCLFPLNRRQQKEQSSRIMRSLFLFLCALLFKQMN